MSNLPIIYFAGKVQDGYRQILFNDPDVMWKGFHENWIFDKEVIYGGSLAFKVNGKPWFGYLHGLYAGTGLDKKCDSNDDYDFENYCAIDLNSTNLKYFGNIDDYPLETEHDYKLYCHNLGCGASKDFIARFSCQCIDNCDIFYATIETADCFGTIAEIGYASKANKPIFIVFSNKLKKELIADLWFLTELPNVKSCWIAKPGFFIPLFNEFCNKKYEKNIKKFEAIPYNLASKYF